MEINCTSCGRVYLKIKEKGHSGTICNSCRSKKLRIKRMDKVLEYKGLKECEYCGYNKSKHSLHFHHKDPTLKSFNLNKGFINKYKWQLILEEIDKCLLICGNCHAIKHIGNEEIKLKEVADGKICSSCKRSLSIDGFYSQRRNKKIKIYSYCKDCHRKVINDRNDLNKKKLVELFGGKCSICSFDKHYRALVFHHLFNKEFEISEKPSANFEVLKKEAEKCILICHNCHGEIHEKEGYQ